MASAPSRRGAPVKEEEAASLPRGRLHLSRSKKVKKEKEAISDAPPEKPWWVVEAEALAAVAAAGGNPEEEFPGEHLIRSRSVNEDYRQVTLDDRQAELWSAMDHGDNFVDLAGPSELPAPKEEEEEEDSFHFSSADDDDGGDGDDADSLDWSAFDGRRH